MSKGIFPFWISKLKSPLSKLDLKSVHLRLGNVPQTPELHLQIPTASPFFNMYLSNHYAVHLKLIQCYKKKKMSTEKKKKKINYVQRKMINII